MLNIGFDKKLIIGSCASIILTIVIVTAINFYQSSNAFLTRGKAGIQNVCDVLNKTVELKYNLQLEKLNAQLDGLVSASHEAGAIMIVDADPAQIEIYDHQKQIKSQALVPRMVFGLEFVTDDYIIIDKVGQDTTSDMAIYQMFEEKLVKVSTNIKGADDSRPIGLYFDNSSPVYQSIMQDQPVTVLSRMADKMAMQVLRPLKDSSQGTIIGAYSVKSPILTRDLVNLINRVTVGGKGLCFVSDTQGRILVHPDDTQITADPPNTPRTKDNASGPAVLNIGGKPHYAFVHHFAPWQLNFTVAVSQEELMAGVTGQMITSAIISGAIALAVCLMIIWLMNRQLVKNMEGMATLAQEVAKGNFNHEFTYTANDAIRTTVDAMNQMVKGLAQMIREINDGVQTLSTASSELGGISDKMNQGADTTVEKVNTVASAAEEMSVNMDSVAAAMEQASTNTQVVASGTQEMTQNIDTVSENSKQTQSITNQAVEQAKLASQRVSRLGQAADQINQVTDTINNISSQTNLLALNATIEAARAGNAGRGFAVVAGEIKELAGQTAGATEDIAKNIQTIQEQVDGAVREIHQISDIIGQIDDYVTQASSAIDLQSATTTQMAENIQQVSLGIKDVNVNISESSQVSGQVAAEISDVLTEAKTISEFSAAVRKKADQLSSVSVQLNQLTARFRI